MSARGATVWLTGLSGAGKTTTAHAVREALRADGLAGVVLDGDELRRGLSSDLGFTAADRDENVRRAGEVARLLNEQGLVVVVALISPRASARRAVRARHEAEGLTFVEVYLDTPLEVCERRDPKALYRRARGGENFQLTGVDDPYEPPTRAELVISTERCAPQEAARAILTALR
jgi:bifunctional enzyme CysN/CysC